MKFPRRPIVFCSAAVILLVAGVLFWLSGKDTPIAHLPDGTFVSLKENFFNRVDWDCFEEKSLPWSRRIVSNVRTWFVYDESSPDPSIDCDFHIYVNVWKHRFRKVYVSRRLTNLSPHYWAGYRCGSTNRVVRLKEWDWIKEHLEGIRTNGITLYNRALPDSEAPTANYKCVIIISRGQLRILPAAEFQAAQNKG
jgi:hypothetical protein